MGEPNRRRPVSRPDPELCLAVLARRDRATIARWEHILGLRWSDVPPLRQVVEHVAVLLLSADMPDRPTSDAIRIAAEALGLEDGSERATHPGDRFARTLCNWQRAAGGKTFRPKKSDAA